MESIPVKWVMTPCLVIVKYFSTVEVPVCFIGDKSCLTPRLSTQWGNNWSVQEGNVKRKWKSLLTEGVCTFHLLALVSNLKHSWL